MDNLTDKVSYWFLKSVSDEDTNYKSNDGYQDEIDTKYVYDSDVANYKQIKSGDIAVIADKEKVLGLAKISRIVISNGKKERRRCPICEKKNTTYDIRTTKTPVYRCNKGHEFDVPASETVEVTTFQAFYSDSFKLPLKLVTVDKIRPYFINNYNQNMSMQRLGEDFFIKYFKDEVSELDKTFVYPSSNEGENFFSDIDNEEYIAIGTDERAKIYRSILQRRGQQNFRQALRDYYGDKCMITGCEILDIVEAAHINPYRGEKDHNISNGLLLRADIHTLFDLDLLGIEPNSLKIYLSESVNKNGYEKLKGGSLKIADKKGPSKNALEIRWEKFLVSNKV